ncbi:unnamed protein product [Prunus armeniaca]|uniref:Uncharacterized protein n=1 Tax=Prunus armeniaca TaxID=36596 RepID=A0A6J5XGD6_PRUAR|nr:unnamed protein product [Prunus armeniaca]
MFSGHKTHRFIKRISFPKFKTALFHFGIIIKKTRAQWSSSSQELRRQPQLQPQEISGEGRCSCTSLHLNRSASKSFGLQQWEPSAACVLQTAWRCCKREKLQKSPRLAKEGGLSATNHHAVSETRHK